MQQTARCPSDAEHTWDQVQLNCTEANQADSRQTLGCAFPSLSEAGFPFNIHSDSTTEELQKARPAATPLQKPYLYPKRSKSLAVKGPALKPD